IGIDSSRVTSQRFTITRDGTPLISGTDYNFIYNPVTNEVTFEAITGQFEFGTYVITLDNSPVGLRDIAGNPLAANQSDGTTSFTFVFLAPPIVSISDTSVVEGDSGTTNAVFTISLTKAP